MAEMEQCPVCGQLVDLTQGHACQNLLGFAYSTGMPSVPAETSEDAANSVAGSRVSMRRRVLDFIQTQGGATDDEIEQGLEMIHQTASARRRELVLLGFVEPSGEKRRTRTGRWALVHKAKR